MTLKSIRHTLCMTLKSKERVGGGGLCCFGTPANIAKIRLINFDYVKVQAKTNLLSLFSDLNTGLL